MVDEDELVAVRRRIEKMTTQDRVQLVIGVWARDDSANWVFEPEIASADNFIILRTYMKYAELLARVRDKLRLRASDITVKMGYQYPAWMDIADGKTGRPEYITDDLEVQNFVEMRRKIEEVNLCVTMAKQVAGIPTVVPKDQMNLQQTKVMSESDSESSGESGFLAEDEWHALALEETLPGGGTGTILEEGGEEGIVRLNSEPGREGGVRIDCPIVTNMPPLRSRLPMKKRKLTTADMVNCSVTRPTTGIRIAEPPRSKYIRRHHPCPAGDKGKGVMPGTGDGSDSDSDDGDDGRVPTYNPLAVDGVGSSNVRRELFPANITPAELEYGIEESATNPNDDPDVGNALQKWGRFNEALQNLLSDISCDNVLFNRDAPPVFNGPELEGVDAVVEDVSYEGYKLFVGRVFKSKADCKIKIAIHAINMKFHFRTTRSTPTFMVLQCISTRCNWRVYAVKLDSSGNFQIRQATLQHSCSVDDKRNYHKLATTQVIGEIMQSKFVGIKKGPTPAGLQKLLLDDFHINVSYWKAWRAREVAMEMSLGSMAGSYALLPPYLGLLQQANRGTICHLEHVEDPGGGQRFKYCFVAYGASISGYHNMRKVIVVDGTRLKGKFGGCLVSACAQDANFQIFPLAFGIVDSENDDAYEWFFSKLSAFVEDSPQLTFISDRHASIYTGLFRVFPHSHHAACTVHLWCNVNVAYKSKRLAGLLSRAAKAFTVTEFNKAFLEIQRISPGCAAYLVDIGFEHWTRAHFGGQRYNMMDSNIAESWNAVIKEAREYPLICMLEYIRTTVMTWFAVHRAKANMQEGKLTPNVRKVVEANFILSTNMAVRPIGDLQFQVQHSTGECFGVNLVEASCTCMEFQALRIPCTHAIAAAANIGVETDAMAAPEYFVETWKLGFAQNIYPVPSVGGERVGIGAGTRSDLMPPAVKRPPGRPRKIRILSRGEFKRSGKKSGRRCTRCRRQGHNKASCRHGMS